MNWSSPWSSSWPTPRVPPLAHRFTTRSLTVLVSRGGDDLPVAVERPGGVRVGPRLGTVRVEQSDLPCLVGGAAAVDVAELVLDEPEGEVPVRRCR